MTVGKEGLPGSLRSVAPNLPGFVLLIKLQTILSSVASSIA